MKVVWPNKYETFGNLQIGDVFRLNGYIYMKTCTFSRANGEINTVNLETGRFNFANDSTEIEKVNGEYVIK